MSNRPIGLLNIKDKERKEIETLTKDFLARGGVINSLDIKERSNVPVSTYYDGKSKSLNKSNECVDEESTEDTD